MVWCATNIRNYRCWPEEPSPALCSLYLRLGNQLLQKLFQFGNESRLELQNLSDVLFERRAVFGIDV
jgi:hypothetical protein